MGFNSAFKGLIMEATHSYETSVNVYQTTRRHILDDNDLDSHSSGNLRSNRNVRFQAVSSRLLAAETRFRSQGSLCEICGIRSASRRSLPQRVLFPASVILSSLLDFLSD